MAEKTTKPTAAETDAKPKADAKPKRKSSVERARAFTRSKRGGNRGKVMNVPKGKVARWQELSRPAGRFKDFEAKLDAIGFDRVSDAELAKDGAPYVAGFERVAIYLADAEVERILFESRLEVRKEIFRPLEQRSKPAKDQDEIVKAVLEKLRAKNQG